MPYEKVDSTNSPPEEVARVEGLRKLGLRRKKPNGDMTFEELDRLLQKAAEKPDEE